MVTPEEIHSRKKRNKIIFYVSLSEIVIIVSAAVTLLANQT